MQEANTEIKNIKTLSSTLKFKVFIIFCAIVHVMIAIFAFVNHIQPLLYFNIGSISVYLLSTLLLNRHLVLIFYIGFTEIIMHSFICILLIGNRFGFAMYFIALVPMSYHLLHAVQTKHYLLKASLLAVISFLLYSTCYLVSTKYEPVYQSDTLTEIAPYIYIVNMLITFAALTFFSILFLIETVDAYNSLYSKNQELNTIANTDPLTGLYNRRTMSEHVRKLYEDTQVSQTQFSLIICDIDDFKLVNDTYGHECGDEVLKAISRQLSTLTRGHDFLCRWGGEEFLILLQNIDVEMARTIAERIRGKLADTDIPYQNETIRITMTFGVASSGEVESYDDLFKLADHRLYQGKNSGKNVVI